MQPSPQNTSSAQSSHSPTLLVAGGLGVVGRAVVEHFEANPAWKVLAISRRTPDYPTQARFLSLDLANRIQCQQVLTEARGVTHVVFAALAPASTPSTEVSIHLAMFTNLIESLEENGAPLERVLLVQGAKVYGAHLGPYRTPAKESDSRHLPPNFYYDQEDYVRERGAARGWSWTAVRPSGMCGLSIGSPMNLALTLGIDGSLCRELHVPLRFPGTNEGYTHIQELTDAGLLARAIAWALTEERCAGEAFNITNGDIIRWQNLWPALATFFGAPLETPLPLPLATFMADKDETWSTMVAKYKLHPYHLSEMAGFEFTDFLFLLNYDVISDTDKARRFGFQECLDSQNALLELLQCLRAKHIIP